ncbi:MAG: DNA-3-methyladenine glycosylase I [Bacteroidales bacterium]|nr:DNA-3-methyladenine glycosylase I [Bacteroidales bacterium]
MSNEFSPIRCPWCGNDPLYVAYHDNEWGRLVPDDEQRLFEFLVLESAQAGLSWITILRKRDGYREAFCGFDAERVAQMTAADVERLIHFDGIVKNRRKIEATINNARLFLDVQREFGSFHTYICSFLPDGKPIVNRPKTLADIPATSKVSDAMSKDMKRRGFKFFGSTMCYAFLQAAGYVDDHFVDCFCKKR